MGMKEWFVPQISEHCPKKIPVWLIKKFVWLSRPEVASVLIPKEGTVQECKTSADVTRNWIWVRKGKIMLLSVSRRRKLEVGLGEDI